MFLQILMLLKLVKIVELQYTDTSVELVDGSFTEIELLEMFLCPCDSILQHTCQPWHNPPL